MSHTGNNLKVRSWVFSIPKRLRVYFLVYEQANAPIMLDLIRQLWDRGSPYYHIMFQQSLEQSPKAGVEYHEHLVKSLEKKDPKGAEKWLTKDLVDSTDYILGLFDRLNL